MIIGCGEFHPGDEIHTIYFRNNFLFYNIFLSTLNIANDF